MPGRGRFLDDDRGEIASSLIMFLVVIGFFLVTVHALFLWYGNTIVKAAAQDALAAGQLAVADVEPGLIGANRVTAQRVGESRLDLFPALTNRDVDVQINLAANLVTVTVKAKVVTPLIADLGTNLETTIVGPIERFYEQNERGDIFSELGG